MARLALDHFLRRDEQLVRRALSHDLAGLVGNRAFPLDLEAILEEFDIGLVSEPTEKCGKAHGYLRGRGASWEIVINESTGPARQRFTIAHELAHYLVEASVGYRPTTSAAYWMLEDACQAFAAELLSPAALVREILAEAPATPNSLLDALPALSARTGLSLEATARRLVEGFEGPAALAAITLPPSSDLADGTVTWLHANSPWVKAGRGQRIHSRYPLWPVITASSDLAVGGRRPVAIGGVSAATVERRGAGLVLLAAIPEGVR